MPLVESKIYNDGNHYIAIPHTERRTKRKRKTVEETIIVDDRETTKKAYFDELYAQSKSRKEKTVKAEVLEKMSEHFDKKSDAVLFVESNMMRKKRNLACRRTRLMRKAALQDFNYFCTFTYDSDKMTEVLFRKKLSYVFNNLSTRKGWKYIGVWERGRETSRLHFHGLFLIPEGTLPGTLEMNSGFSFSTKRRQHFLECTYFAERFGRNEFAPIERERDYEQELIYMVKYIEKTGGKIVYSRGLPQFFISDVMDEDIVCPYDEEQQKYVLADDFACYDQGEYKGQVSPKVIAEMRKLN